MAYDLNMDNNVDDFIDLEKVEEDCHGRDNSVASIRVNLSRGSITTFETPPEVVMSWSYSRFSGIDLCQESSVSF